MTVVDFAPYLAESRRKQQVRWPAYDHGAMASLYLIPFLLTLLMIEHSACQCRIGLLRMVD